MEQFNLNTWLKDKSRKVVTRLKKSVQIISTEGKEDIPIVALVEGIAHQYKPNGYHADVITAYSNQCLDMGDYDLFFADKEEELSEFEKEYKKLYTEGYADGQAGSKPLSDKVLKECATELFDLARKEILKELKNYQKNN